MMAKLLCMMLLGFSLTSAAAQELWSFTYTGFRDPYWPYTFFPNATFAGSFESKGDANGNGVLELDEVTNFDFKGVQYGDDSSCLTRPTCRLVDFAYVLHNGYFRLSVLDYEVDSGGTAWWSRFVSGDGLTVGHGSDEAGWSESPILWWDMRTRLEIAPVPEPAAGAMLLAGLALLARALKATARAGAPAVA